MFVIDFLGRKRPQGLPNVPPLKKTTSIFIPWKLCMAFALEGVLALGCPVLSKPSYCVAAEVIYVENFVLTDIFVSWTSWKNHELERDLDVATKVFL